MQQKRSRFTDIENKLVVTSGVMEGEGQSRGREVRSTTIGYKRNYNGLPDGAISKEPARQCRRCKRRRFDPWVGEIPWRRKWQPPPVFLPGESHGQRNLAGYSPWGCKELDKNEHTYIKLQ